MEKYVYLAKYKDSVGRYLEYHYKIGFTQNVDDRMEQIPGTTHFEIEEIWSCKTKNYSKLEKWLHEYYKEHHFEGEWFIFPPKKIASVIEVMKEKQQYFDSLNEPEIVDIKNFIENKDIMEINNKIDNNIDDNKIDDVDIINDKDIIDEQDRIEVSTSMMKQSDIKLINTDGYGRECPYCHKSFTKQHNLDYHLNIAKKKCTDIMIVTTPKIKTYICPVCNISFKRLYGMKQHYKKFHEDNIKLSEKQKTYVVNINNNINNNININVNVKAN